MSADSDAQKGQDDYEVASTAWKEYRAASDEILQLSREGKQQEASKLMTGEVYEDYKSFAKKLTILRDEFQVELDRAKTMANVCTIIIFIVIVAAGLAIAVVTTLIGRIITNSITEPVEQIEAAVASQRKGELSNVEMLTYESEDELGETIRNLKEAMGILADYVSEISVEVKAIAQGDLTKNGDDITDFLGDFSELKTSLLYILKRFNSTLTEISNLAEKVSSNSSEVENASKSLADGATEQAGVIEELNATIDTVVDLAADTAKETQNASARVKASANKANEEKEKMNELLTEMEHITECMDDYLYIFDLQNNTFEISQSAVKRFNMSKNVLTDAANEVMKVVYEEDRRMLAKHLADICEGRENVHNLHYRWLDKEGMPVWINCRGIVIIDQQGKAEYLVGCLNETGNRRRADNVTGLLGGPEFLTYLRAQKEPITKGFFMHVGIDDFGAINSFRVADQYVIVDLEASSAEDAVALKEKITDKLRNFIIAENYEAIFSISIGVIDAATFCEGTEECRKKFEFALKQAKSMGKNGFYIFDQDDYEAFYEKEES